MLRVGRLLEIIMHGISLRCAVAMVTSHAFDIFKLHKIRHCAIERVGVSVKRLTLIQVRILTKASRKFLGYVVFFAPTNRVPRY
jgi:hypothetical protein